MFYIIKSILIRTELTDISPFVFYGNLNNLHYLGIFLRYFYLFIFFKHFILI